jgi:serine acetyltransferase
MRMGTWCRALGNRAVLAATRRVAELGRITSATAAGRRFAHFGDGSAMAYPQGALVGERWISVGHFTLIGPHVTISAGFVPEIDLGSEPIVRIGSGVVLGRGSHVVGHQSIDIGDDVFTGPYVYITDQNHGYQDPDVPVGKQWPVNEPVSIGAGSWIGTGAVVLPGARIGRNVVVAAGSVVRGEVPDMCVVAGVPAKVVRRYSEEDGWISPRTAEPER